MIQSIFTGSMGITAQQKRLDVIANNVANVNTDVFKSSSVEFKDALYKSLRHPILEKNGDENLERGHGVLVNSTRLNFTQGTMRQTEQAFDFALTGKGFFVTSTADGEVRYSRQGIFAVSAEEGGNYLVNAQGNYVLDTNGQRISLPSDISEFNVNLTGDIFIGTEPTGARIAVAEFENETGLVAVGDMNFIPSDSSGEAMASATTMRQGYLEGSNVDLAMEMTRMIRAQRAFTLASKAVTTADNMEGLSNTLRR